MGLFSTLTKQRNMTVTDFVLTITYWTISSKTLIHTKDKHNCWQVQVAARTLKTTFLQIKGCGSKK